MCVSCGCGDVNDNHGDSRNITLGSLDAAAEAAGTTRGRVVQNIAQMSESISSSPMQTASARGDYYGSVREPIQTGGVSSGEAAPGQGDLGEAAGLGWQESQQTESGGEVNL